MLKELVSQIIRQNPTNRRNYNYLLLSVWEKQGLKLYPNQVEALLKKCSNASSIIRAAQREGTIMDAEKDAMYKDHKKFFTSSGLK